MTAEQAVLDPVVHRDPMEKMAPTSAPHPTSETLPVVLKVKGNQSVVHLRLLVDENQNGGAPIDRSADVPGFSSNGEVLTDQHAMRKDIRNTAIID